MFGVRIVYTESLCYVASSSRGELLHNKGRCSTRLKGLVLRHSYKVSELRPENRKVVVKVGSKFVFFQKVKRNGLHGC